MKRKSFLGRVAIIAAALTLATTSMMSGTLARYETNASITPYALVARWNPAITAVSGGADLTQTTNATVDLALTATDNGTYASKIGGKDTTATSNRMIAPGTTGRYQFKVDVTKADVPVILKVTAKPKTDYNFPNNLVVKIMNEDAIGTPYGTLKATVNGSGQYTPVFGTQKKPADIIGGMSAEGQPQKPLYFESHKENPSAVREKTFTLVWEWPYDAESLPTGLTSALYNAEDNMAGKGTASTDGSVSNNKFGFDLDITLMQAGKVDTSSVTVVGSDN